MRFLSLILIVTSLVANAQDTAVAFPADDTMFVFPTKAEVGLTYGLNTPAGGLGFVGSYRIRRFVVPSIGVGMGYSGTWLSIGDEVRFAEWKRITLSGYGFYTRAFSSESPVAYDKDYSESFSAGQLILGGVAVEYLSRRNGHRLSLGYAHYLQTPVVTVSDGPDHDRLLQHYSQPLVDGATIGYTFLYRW